MQLRHLTQMMITDTELPLSRLLNILDLPNLSSGTVGCTRMLESDASLQNEDSTARLASILDGYGVGLQSNSSTMWDTLSIVWDPIGEVDDLPKSCTSSSEDVPTMHVGALLWSFQTGIMARENSPSTW